MSWIERFTWCMVAAGWGGLREILSPGILEYVQRFEHDAEGDIYRIAAALLESSGPKIVEGRAFRAIVLATLPVPSLRELAGKFDLDTTQPAPALASAIAGRPWRWESAESRLFLGFFGAQDAEAAYRATVIDQAEVPQPPRQLSRAPDGFYELHTYQSEAIDRIFSKFDDGHQKLLLQLPTGGGKTRTAAHAVARRLRDLPGSALWLAYEPLLVDQACETMTTIWPQVGPFEVEVRRCFRPYSDSMVITAEDRVLLFGSAQTTASRARRDSGVLASLRNVRLVVFDEAHKIVARVARGLVNELLFQNPDIRLLGLTATPGRAADEEAERFTSYFDALVRMRVPDTGGYYGAADSAAPTGSLRSAIQYLQDTRVLARLNHELLAHDDGTMTLDALSRAPVRNRLILDRIQHAFEEQKSTLVFCCNVEHCNMLAHLLRLRGVPSGIVLGSNPDQRERLINEFRAGSLLVLLSFEVLTTGFDAPEIDTLIVTRPTGSVVTYSQMLGRALRGPRNGGHPVNTVVNVGSPRFGNEISAYTHFSQYWS